MVRRRPPHPLDKPRLRVARSRRSGDSESQKASPKGNLEVLRQARVDADDTRGLLPQPKENPEWAARFDLTYMEQVRQIAAKSEREGETPPLSTNEEDVRPPVTNNGPKRRVKYNPDQKKLF